MKALVTGGGGFIGSNLVRLLLERGAEVRVLDNFSTGYRENLAPFAEVEIFEGDIRDGDIVSKAVKGVEVIFHLAASVGNTRSIENPLEDAGINILGTIHVLENAKRLGVKKLVCTSSAATFGELKKLPISEDHPAEPDSPYGVSKLASEKIALVYNKLYDMEVACLRYFNVYGINQRYDAYGNAIPIFAKRILSNNPIEIYGDGEQTRDFVNVWDVAEANYQAATTAGAHGPFNVASGSRITINKLVEMMYGIVGITPQVIYGPPRKGDVRHSLADISHAAAIFGFQPSVDLRKGLQEYLEWSQREMKAMANEAKAMSA